VTRRNVLALLLGVIVAAACVRLGIWQLHRLEERRARNALVRARLEEPAVPPAALLGAPADSVRYRRVRLTGTWDFDREIALAGRPRDGAPGVNLLTPLRPDDPGAPAVLVNRGWVYSPDAASVDVARWREREPAAAVEGYAVDMEYAERAAPGAPAAGRVWRAVTTGAVESAFPYPVAPFYVVMQDPAADGVRGGEASLPARLPAPRLDEGSHRGYAVQWFSFAAIALVGVSALIWQDVRERRALTRRA
jgi:surfeit locus 1 family protein